MPGLGSRVRRCSAGSWRSWARVVNVTILMPANSVIFTVTRYSRSLRLECREVLRVVRLAGGIQLGGFAPTARAYSRSQGPPVVRLPRVTSPMARDLRRQPLQDVASIEASRYPGLLGLILSLRLLVDERRRVRSSSGRRRSRSASKASARRTASRPRSGDPVALGERVDVDAATPHMGGRGGSGAGETLTLARRARREKRGGEESEGVSCVSFF
jgi:hypothetical protein